MPEQLWGDHCRGDHYPGLQLSAFLVSGFFYEIENGSNNLSNLFAINNQWIKIITTFEFCSKLDEYEGTFREICHSVPFWDQMAWRNR